MRYVNSTRVLLCSVWGLCCVLAAGAVGQEIRRLPPIFDPPTPFSLAAPDSTDLTGGMLVGQVDSPTPLPAAEVYESLPAPTPAEGPAGDAAPDAIVPELVSLGAPEEFAGPSPVWYTPTYWFGPAPWDIGIEFGLNGSSGTSDSLSTRSGGFIKRKTKHGKLDTSLYHNRTNSNGEESQNNAKLTLRYDWMLGASPWSVFLNNQTYYDRFQSFDLRTNVISGFGYDVVDAEFLKFSTSLGAGAAREFGGDPDKWVPEAQGGVNWEQKISDTQEFTAKLDYFPELGNWNNYRLQSDIGWVVALSYPSNASIKFSLSDTFDSDPNGVNPHNTNYSVLLLWKK